jgi:hypothetical protein
MAPNRRELAAMLAGTGLFLITPTFVFGASDFWNKKSKNEWSSDEIHILTTRSPWAKDVRIEYRKQLQPNFDGTPGGLTMPDNSTNNGLPPGLNQGARVNVPLGSNGADTGSAVDNPRRGVNRNVPLEAMAATIRWESAQPVLDALGRALGEEFQGRYVISVKGLPLRTDPRAVAEAILKSSASLLAKGKEPAQAGVVLYSKDGATVLFGFAKEFLPLTSTDKDVQFVLNTGDIELRARFDPKEMMYKGQLAI